MISTFWICYWIKKKHDYFKWTVGNSQKMCITFRDCDWDHSNKLTTIRSSAYIFAPVKLLFWLYVFCANLIYYIFSVNYIDHLKLSMYFILICISNYYLNIEIDFCTLLFWFHIEYLQMFPYYYKKPTNDWLNIS